MIHITDIEWLVIRTRNKAAPKDGVISAEIASTLLKFDGYLPEFENLLFLKLSAICYPT